MWEVGSRKRSKNYMGGYQEGKWKKSVFLKLAMGQYVSSIVLNSGEPGKWNLKQMKSFCSTLETGQNIEVKQK